MFNWLVKFVCNCAGLVKCKTERSIPLLILSSLLHSSSTSSLMSMLEPEEMDEFDDDELLLLS